jgi:phosphopantothenoylcysteine decarboxylase/phosphopantothenate--cysteine ligase
MSTARSVADQDVGGAGDALRSYGTGLLRTTVHREGTAFRWTRVPGPDAPHAFVSRDAAEEECLRPLADEGTGGVRLALGEPWAEGRRYRAAGGVAMAWYLLAGGGTEYTECVRGLGRVLRRLHDTPLERLENAGALDTPRGLRRLSTWLGGGPGAGRSDEARDEARRRLGAGRWRMLREWCARSVEADDPVLSHGAPGLGALVPGTDGADAVLLTGEDLSLAPWTFDVGWVVGEICELSWQFQREGPDWTALLDALFDGYGRDLGGDWHRWAALRVALHLHDFCSYTDAPFTEATAYAGFVGHLIDMEEA